MRGLLVLPILVPLVIGDLGAQDEPPVAVLRGSLAATDMDAKTVDIATRDQRIHHCTFDEETFFTGRAGRIRPEQAEVGQRVDAVVDRRAGDGSCKALTIYVLVLDRSRGDTRWEQQYREALARQRHVLDHIFPRGDLTFAGVVVEADAKRLVLRTRHQGRLTLRLRYDTRFTDQGRPSDAAMLEVNTRVFVRAGRGIDGLLEAYQVVRGDILMPD